MIKVNAGENASDTDVVQLGSAGTISTTNEAQGSLDVSVTVIGYFTDGSQSSAGETYASVAQTTLVDTRSGIGAPQAQIPAGGSLTVQVGGQDGIPSDAAGAALFVGAANATSTGFLSVYPAGGTDPSLSMLSYQPGEVVRDLYFGALSPSGQLTIANHSSGSVDLVINTRGYLVSPTSATEDGASYTGLTPVRILDTRNTSAVPAGGSVTFTATGVGGVPSSGVAEVQESVAALNPTATGDLTVYPEGRPDPDSPTVNFNAGDGQDNDQNAAVVSSVSPTGEETITNHSSGTVEVVVSVRGYWTSPEVPDAATVLPPISGSSGTVLEWSPPDTDGGAPIATYTITTEPPTSTWQVSGDVNSVNLGNLPSGPYVYQVTAVNLLGSGYTASFPPSGAVGDADPLGTNTTSDNITAVCGSDSTCADWYPIASSTSDQQSLDSSFQWNGGGLNGGADVISAGNAGNGEPPVSSGDPGTIAAPGPDAEGGPNDSFTTQWSGDTVPPGSGTPTWSVDAPGSQGAALADSNASGVRWPNYLNLRHEITWQPTVYSHMAAVVRLVLITPSGSIASCSGVMMSKYLALTSGHCLYHYGQGGWVTWVEVIPGNYGGRSTSDQLAGHEPYGYCTARDAIATNGWVQDGNSQEDYGGVVIGNCYNGRSGSVGRDLGDRVGWFGYWATNGDSFENVTATLRGYPNGWPLSKPYGSLWAGSGAMYNSFNATRMQVAIRAGGGDSGGPLWVNKIPGGGDNGPYLTGLIETAIVDHIDPSQIDGTIAMKMTNTFVDDVLPAWEAAAAK
jgi:V8-like Glu-specific endopeptidase